MFLKWKKLIYKLIIIASVLGVSRTVKADEIDKTQWVNWSSHTQNTFENYVYSVGQNPNASGKPWYITFSDETELGVFVAYTYTGATRPQIFYFSSSPTFKGYDGYNAAANGMQNVPTMTTYNLSKVNTNSTTTLPGYVYNQFGFNQTDKPLYYKSFYSSFAFFENHCDITINAATNGDFSGLEDYLEDVGYKNPDSVDPDDPNQLPFLSFGLKKTLVPGFPQLTKMKLELTWDYTTQDVYKSNPQDYVIEMIVSARFKDAPTGLGLIRDTSDTSINDNCKMVLTNGGTNIAANSFSWIYADVGKKLYAINPDNVNWGDESGYFLYVRIRNSDDSKSTDYKVYNVAMNGLVAQENIAYDRNGQETTLPDSAIDIGTGSGGDGNGDGVSPPSYSQDASTSANADPTSSMYDNSSGNFNIATAIGTLKDIVNQLQQLPTMFATVFTFFPSWFLDLLVISLSLFITIGVVKLIVK